MAVTFWALVGLATIAGFSMAWALGANSDSPPLAPAIGANAVSTMRAAFLIGILAALGGHVFLVVMATYSVRLAV